MLTLSTSCCLSQLLAGSQARPFSIERLRWKKPERELWVLPGEEPAGTTQSVPVPSRRSSGSSQVVDSEIGPQLSCTRTYGPARWVVTESPGVLQVYRPWSPVYCAGPPLIE